MSAIDAEVLKLVKAIQIVYPECTQDMLATWIWGQQRNGISIEVMYSVISDGSIRFSVQDGFLIASHTYLKPDLFPLSEDLKQKLEQAFGIFNK